MRVSRRIPLMNSRKPVEGQKICGTPRQTLRKSARIYTVQLELF